METIDKRIEVEAPISAVYEKWSHFESFPQFMEGVESVTLVDDKHLHWVADVSGQRREWDAEILQQIPERKISWQSTRGAINSGTVDFRARDPQHTLILLHLEYEPRGLMERMGSSLGLLSRRIDNDLERFKQHIQEHKWPEKANSYETAQRKSEVPADYDTSGKSGV